MTEEKFQIKENTSIYIGKIDIIIIKVLLELLKR